MTNVVRHGLDDVVHAIACHPVSYAAAGCIPVPRGTFCSQYAGISAIGQTPDQLKAGDWRCFESARLSRERRADNRAWSIEIGSLKCFMTVEKG